MFLFLFLFLVVMNVEWRWSVVVRGWKTEKVFVEGRRGRSCRGGEGKVVW
jgi:hypothetical protein